MSADSAEHESERDHLFDDVQTPDPESDTDLSMETPDLDDVEFSESDEWDKEKMPAEWLLHKTGRAQLVRLALEQLESGDAIYLNKSEIGEASDTSRYTAHRHCDILADMGVFETRGDKIDRYRANSDSTVLAAIAQLNDEIIDHD